MYDPDQYIDDLDRQRRRIERVSPAPVIIGLIIFWAVIAAYFW